MERVRTAYRETVMSVAHYDEVYAESLVENLAVEFGRDLAEGVGPETSVPLTQPLLTALRRGARQAVQDRQTFITALDREAQSLEQTHSDLNALLAQVDSISIPSRYRDPFVDQLDGVAQERQEAIRSRQAVPCLDEHTLCAYLYRDKPWTYPGLTAVTRLREAVALSRQS